MLPAGVGNTTSAPLSLLSDRWGLDEMPIETDLPNGGPRDVGAIGLLPACDATVSGTGLTLGPSRPSAFCSTLPSAFFQWPEASFTRTGPSEICIESEPSLFRTTRRVGVVNFPKSGRLAFPPTRDDDTHL